MSVLAGLLRRDPGASDPLAVEADLAGDLADLFPVAQRVNDRIGEGLAGGFVGVHGAPVGAAEASQFLPAFFVHVLMMPQHVRHRPVAISHGYQYATTKGHDFMP